MKYLCECEFSKCTMETVEDSLDVKNCPHKKEEAHWRLLEEDKATVRRKYAPGDYVWYKEYGLPAIVEAITYDDPMKYKIKWHNGRTLHLEVVHEKELEKGFFHPYDATSFPTELVGKSVVEWKTGNIYVVNGYITDLPNSTSNPAVIIGGKVVSLYDLYANYEIDGHPCGEFFTRGW